MNFKNKTLIFLLLLIFAKSIFCMKYAKIVNCPNMKCYNDLKGKIVSIIGTEKEVWDIDNIRSPKIARLPVVIIYLATQPPQDGKVYYGKVDSLGYCFHESWLQEISETEAEIAKNK